MLTNQELQTLRNQGNEAEAAADEIASLRARVLELEAVHEDASGAVLAERERIYAHIRSAMGHAEAGYDDVAWRLLASLVGPNV